MHTHTQPDLPHHAFEVMAIHDFSLRETDELPLTEGEKLIVLDKPFDGWYLARNQQG